MKFSGIKNNFYPTPWKEANMIMTWKKDKITSYHPISLLDKGNAFEKILQLESVNKPSNTPSSPNPIWLPTTPIHHPTPSKTLHQQHIRLQQCHVQPSDLLLHQAGLRTKDSYSNCPNYPPHHLKLMRSFGSNKRLLNELKRALIRILFPHGSVLALLPFILYTADILHRSLFANQ